ncbi:MAG: aminoglycoside phosphotransferase family protein [Planctomycetota bacterium]
MNEPTTTAEQEALIAARATLDELGLVVNEAVRLRPLSGHHSSLLLPCRGPTGREFVLKQFVRPDDARFYPPEVRLDDFPRRECAFYRYLDGVDPDRRDIPAPRTVLLDPLDPPRWILLEWIVGAPGPSEESLGIDQVMTVMDALRSLRAESMLGRRDFPLNHWDVVSYVERVRLMYDPLLSVIGQRRWRRALDFFDEAVRWTETRLPVVVHGDFTEQNILVDAEGNPFLIDFERIGTGNEDHDFAWLWIHSTRGNEWKRSLLERWFGTRWGSDRIKSEWGIRSAIVYLAMRRLRFGRLKFGIDDQNLARNLALLDAALDGGAQLFPV